jgi:hypothetical protein
MAHSPYIYQPYGQWLTFAHPPPETLTSKVCEARSEKRKAPV